MLLRPFITAVLLVLFLTGCDRQGGNDKPTKGKIDVVQVLTEPLDPNKTCLWTIVSQLSWRSLTEAFGVDLQAFVPDPLISELNRNTNGMALPPKQYWYARAGLISDHVVDRINSDLKARFPQYPPYAPSRQIAADQCVAFALFHLNSLFEPPYHRYHGSISFKSEGQSATKVQAFGLWLGDNAPDSRANCELLFVHQENEESKWEFAVELASKAQISVIVARIQPGPTLQATLEHLRELQRKERKGTESPQDQKLRDDDTVLIPSLAWHVEREDQRLVNKTLTTRDGQKILLGTSKTVVDFQLNESGVEVKAINDRYAASSGPRGFGFNSPFLIVVGPRGDNPPWFCAWVGNTDVLIPAK